MKLSDISVHTSRVLVLPLAAVALAAALVAQPEKPYKVDIEGDYIVLSVDENAGIPIKDFIKITENITKKTYTYDNNDFQNPDNKIHFIGSMRIKKSNFFSFFQTVLYMKDFACVLRGEADTEMVQIIFMRGPKRPEITTGARLVLPEDLEQYKNQTLSSSKNLNMTYRPRGRELRNCAISHSSPAAVRADSAGTAAECLCNASTSS